MLANDLCRISDQGTTLRAADLHNAFNQKLFDFGPIWLKFRRADGNKFTKKFSSLPLSGGLTIPSRLNFEQFFTLTGWSSYFFS